MLIHVFPEKLCTIANHESLPGHPAIFATVCGLNLPSFNGERQAFFLQTVSFLCTFFLTPRVFDMCCFFLGR